MDKIEQLRSIAEFLGLSNIAKELSLIELRSKQENANIILPLVGEFSSGKTTLVNALTDSKSLESATKPTTATIYEIHFGCDTCRAEVVDANGNRIEVSEISDLKNDALADAKVVTVFDTSTRVPSSTIIVDTPGLSSPDPKHRQTLVNFLPKADGILLVTDINQQITRSLTDFIEMIKLSQRPIYLVLTKSDTKSEGDIESAKAHISKNCEIPLKQVAVVSATKNSLSDLYSLFDTIQHEKKDILRRVDEQRLKDIVKFMADRIEDLMSASSSDKNLDEAILQSQSELKRIKRNIERLVESVSDDITEQERTTTRKFEDTVFDKLNTLVTGKSTDFDNDALMVINSTASLLMNSYRNGVQNAIREKANRQRGTENEISLSSLENMDLSNIQMTDLSYSMDLNSMGHEYDRWIKVGVIAAAAVGTVAVVASTGGVAAVATAAEGALAGNKAIDVVDTVSDVGSIISNKRTANRIEKAVSLASKAVDKYETIESGAQKLSTRVGSDKGLIDSMVGFVTDKLLSKPQRIRAIRNYIDSSLSPDFKNRLCEISQQLVNTVRESLGEEATELIGQKTDALNQLKTECKEQKERFEQRMSQLREYKTMLLTL
ncbi:dynamin family protein [Tannerella forsythia]|jgi:elongation factor Tu GTP binding domain|uniref:GTPase Era n=1 Tax=Tannerella forsythia TaxID=28112 RepID=A0A1D3UDZ9_TANFO|nr:dynamin family protein [Tannerella forsythia]SCQ18258.1 GTPase Era [Tannerella forsythia]